jgi:hypothetical protein
LYVAANDPFIVSLLPGVVVPTPVLPVCAYRLPQVRKNTVKVIAVLYMFCLSIFFLFIVP